MMTLRDYLATTGTSQVEFARRIGTSQPRISDWCAFEPTISLENAVLVERVTEGAVPVEVWPQFRVLLQRFPHPEGVS